MSVLEPIFCPAGAEVGKDDLKVPAQWRLIAVHMEKTRPDSKARSSAGPLPLHNRAATGGSD